MRRWAETRERLRKEHPTCKVCVTKHLNVRRATKDAAAASFERLGGVPEALECAFARAGATPTAWVDALPVDRAWGDHKSTLVFECPVPGPLREAACDAGGRVVVAARRTGSVARAHPPVPLLLQRPVFPAAGPPSLGDDGAVALGACVWTRGDAYIERDVGKALPRGPPRTKGCFARTWLFE